jgi:hypothetical protein
MPATHHIGHRACCRSRDASGDDGDDGNDADDEPTLAEDEHS